MRRKLTFTKREAIQVTKKLWTWLAKTGKQKNDWPGFERLSFYVTNQCPLCMYAKEKTGVVPEDLRACKVCPYFERTGVLCVEEGEPYAKFYRASRLGSSDAKQKRKLSAKEFLERLGA